MCSTPCGHVVGLHARIAPRIGCRGQPPAGLSRGEVREILRVFLMFHGTSSPILVLRGSTSVRSRHGVLNYPTSPDGPYTHRQIDFAGYRTEGKPNYPKMLVSSLDYTLVASEA